MTNLTLHPDIRALGEKLMEARKFKKLTPYVEQLIREDWERRHGPLMIANGVNREIPREHRENSAEVNSAEAPGSFQNLTEAFAPKNPAPKRTVKTAKPVPSH